MKQLNFCLCFYLVLIMGPGLHTNMISAIYVGGKNITIDLFRYNPYKANIKSTYRVSQAHSALQYEKGQLI